MPVERSLSLAPSGKTPIVHMSTPAGSLPVALFSGPTETGQLEAWPTAFVMASPSNHLLAAEPDQSGAVVRSRQLFQILHDEGRERDSPVCHRKCFACPVAM